MPASKRAHPGGTPSACPVHHHGRCAGRMPHPSRPLALVCAVILIINVTRCHCPPRASAAGAQWTGPPRAGIMRPLSPGSATTRAAATPPPTRPDLSSPTERLRPIRAPYGLAGIRGAERRPPAHTADDASSDRLAARHRWSPPTSGPRIWGFSRCGHRRSGPVGWGRPEAKSRTPSAARRGTTLIKRGGRVTRSERPSRTRCMSVSPAPSQAPHLTLACGRRVWSLPLRTS